MYRVQFKLSDLIKETSNKKFLTRYESFRRLNQKFGSYPKDRLLHLSVGSSS